MRRIIKGVFGRTWKPFVEWYLRRPRSFQFLGISLVILPGVFHPGFFFSSKFFARQLRKLDLSGKTFLEIGAGSGLISILAAKQNARVIATDISPIAISCTTDNALRNGVGITILESDLFKNIPAQAFDFIAVNPPYFKKDPISIAERAWYCGKNLEYFRDFFQQSKTYTHNGSCIKMVLSDECDLNGIQALAAENKYTWELEIEKRTAWEKGYIFNMRPMKDGKL